MSSVNDMLFVGELLFFARHGYSHHFHIFSSLVEPVGESHI